MTAPVSESAVATASRRQAEPDHADSCSSCRGSVVPVQPTVDARLEVARVEHESQVREVVAVVGRRERLVEVEAALDRAALRARAVRPR